MRYARFCFFVVKMVRCVVGVCVGGGKVVKKRTKCKEEPVKLGKILAKILIKLMRELKFQ